MTKSMLLASFYYAAIINEYIYIVEQMFIKRHVHVTCVVISC